MYQQGRVGRVGRKEKGIQCQRTDRPELCSVLKIHKNGEMEGDCLMSSKISLRPVRLRDK